MTGRLPDFLIVGTPRSGTTLVQRLASEIPGVAVPAETHFFTEFAPDLLRRRSLPVAGDDLREELRRYRARPYLDGVELEVDDVFDALGGSCSSLLDLWGAVLEQVTGDDPVVGEKTPGHLLWWEPLTRALPHLALVAVVRDPRAVVHSYLALGWGGHPVLTARRWSEDVERVRAAQDALGERCLVLRYEDVVVDPAAGRARIAALLGRPVEAGGLAPTVADRGLFPAWETWKRDALADVDPTRADAWRGQLPEPTAVAVAAVCRRGMVDLGYSGSLSAPGALMRRARLHPGVRLRLIRSSVVRRRREAGIRRMAVSLVSPGAPASMR